MDIMKAVFPMTTDKEHQLPFVIKGIGIQFNQEHIIRPNGFPHYHWAHCASGEGKLLISGNEYIISPGTGFLLKPGFPHEYFTTKRPWKVYWLTFDGYALPKLLSYLNIPEWAVLNLGDIEATNQNLLNIYECLSSEYPHKNLDASILLYDFLSSLKEATLTSQGALSERIAQLLPVIGYMEHNYNNYPTIEDMAALINITPHHLCRIFKDAFTLSPFQYLTQLRVQKAKELLISNPTMLVKDIAISVGYNDPSYFSCIFRRHQGMTPMEFRKMHGYAQFL